MHWTLSAVMGMLTICAAAQGDTAQAVYKSGDDGYHTYRIPALLVTQKGTLLAFCEGRKSGGSDAGNIDMLVKRSEDGGKTWSAQTVVWDDADNTCGNPCPVVDESTGFIWLPMTWNLGTDRESDIIKGLSKDTRRVYITHSEDDGKTWAKAEEITAKTKLPNWTWYATGPCTGIQLRAEKYKGRMIIPCDHIEAGSDKYYSHVIYSDDHGKTWLLGGRTPEDQVNECQAAELEDGRLMLNMRNYDTGMKTRAVSFSEDGGMTWGQVRRDPALPEPICQASLLRYTLPAGAPAPFTVGKACLLLSNPASAEHREKMTIKASLDNGQSWPLARLVYEGPSAYSCLAALPGGDIGLLYEGGPKKAYQNIFFQRFSPAWLTGADK